jgi:hypothetical protein
MRRFFKLGLTGTLLAVLAAPAAAVQQRGVGDKDDQMVITGCVMHAGKNNTAGPRSLLVWSRGDIYLDESAIAETKPSERAVATAGIEDVVLYWLDDEDDFAKHAGKKVEIVGEMSALEKGDVEVENKGPFTEIEFDVKGSETKVQVPTAWLMIPDREKDFEVMVRTIDVEKVTVIGACGR